MWDSPSWIGNAMRAKTTERASRYTADVNAYIAEENRRNAMEMKRMELETNAQIASDDRAARAEQNQLDRESREKIAREQNVTSTVNTTMRTLPTLMPIATVGALTSTINSDQGKKNNNNNGNNNKPGGEAQVVIHKTAEDIRREKAREKAEKLFPELSEELGVSTELRPLDISTGNVLTNYMQNKGTQNKFTSVPALSSAGAAIATGARLLTIIPFI